MIRFAGTYTALVTPLRENGVDFPALEKLIRRQLDAGVAGIVPCGTTGEAPTLARGEYYQVIECAIRVAHKRAPVIAGTGSYNTADAVHMSQHAEHVGAAAVLVVNPYYNKPNQDGLYRHFAAIAESISLPVILYNIPGRTGVALTIDTIRRLRDSFENIVAVKHATGAVQDADALLQVCDIDVLSGDDPLTLALMSIGATGVISVASNVAPRLVKRLTDAMRASDLEGARAAHRALLPLARMLLELDTNPLPVKTALALRGYCAAEFRLPLTPLSDDKRQRLEELLESVPWE